MVQNQQKKLTVEELQENLDIRLKGNYAMLIRATELAALASFQVLALLEELDKKGVVSKEVVLARGEELSKDALQKLRDMAFFAEEAVDKATMG